MEEAWLRFALQLSGIQKSSREQPNLGYIETTTSGNSVEGVSKWEPQRGSFSTTLCVYTAGVRLFFGILSV